MQENILVVDDNDDIRSNVAEYLRAKGWKAEEASTGPMAVAQVHTGAFDLVLLDLGLPGMDGIEVCRKLRSEGYSLPIMMLTARDELDDRVAGLQSGADDYLVKPFSFQELEARIKALLRRNKETVTNQLTCDNLVLDCNTRRAKRGDADIDLTVKEYRLLEYFMTHQGVALSRITLLKDVWDKNFDTNTNIVDVYVNYLRVKIDRDFDKKLIHTVVGLGYIMNA